MDFINQCIFLARNCSSLCKRILRLIEHSLRLVKANLFELNPNILKYLKERFSVMAKGNSPMVRIISLDQHMAVKSSHLRNSKDLVATGSTSPWAI